MPTKHKSLNDKTQKSPLLKWLFWAPLKFTALFIALMIPLLLLMNFFFTKQYFQTSYFVSIVAVLIISAFSVYKVMRWTPDDQLDHKSFVMLNTAQNIISVIFLGIIGFISLYMSGITNFNMAVASAMIIGLLTIFLVANGLLKIKSLFCRARIQNVPKWKLWLSMPLGINLFWYSGFLIPDNKNNTPVLKTKSKPFDTLINWIIKKPLNTIITFLFFIAFGGMMIATQISAMIIFYAISLLFMVVLLLWKKLRNNLGKWFATFTVILNIAAIIGILVALAYIPKQPTITGEQIKITEIKK